MNQEHPAGEREEQIAVLHNLRKRWGKVRRELHPRSLLRARGAFDGVSKECVRELVEVEYSDPVVSLYLERNPVQATPQALLRVFHALRTAALEERRDFLAALSRSQKFTLDHDLKEIEAFRSEYLLPVHLRSLVIFRSGDRLQVVKLGVCTPDTLRIDPHPYVMPLEAVLENNEGSCSLKPPRKRADF